MASRPPLSSVRSATTSLRCTASGKQSSLVPGGLAVPLRNGSVKSVTDAVCGSSLGAAAEQRHIPGARPQERRQKQSTSSGTETRWVSAAHPAIASAHRTIWTWRSLGSVGDRTCSSSRRPVSAASYSSLHRVPPRQADPQHERAPVPGSSHLSKGGARRGRPPSSPLAATDSNARQAPAEDAVEAPLEEVHPPYLSASQMRAGGPSDPSRVPSAASAELLVVPIEHLTQLLRSPTHDDFQLARRQLGIPHSKINLYLALRRRAPHLLREVSDWQVCSLFRHAAAAGYSSVFRMLIGDVIGEDIWSLGPGAPTEGVGLFEAGAGTERRTAALTSLILASAKDPQLHTIEITVHAFELLVQDLAAVRNAEAMKGQDATSSEQTIIPPRFPVGEAHRLIDAIVSIGSPDLVPSLQALQTFLAERTPSFPSASIGSSLIAFYLSEPVQDQQAAIQVVKLMRETNAISVDALTQAQEDGQAWLEQACQRLVGNDTDLAAAPAPFRRKALDITLRLVALKGALQHYDGDYLQARLAFEALFRLLRTDCVGDAASDVLPVSADIGVKHLRGALRIMMTRPRRRVLQNALAILQRADRNVLALVDPADIQSYCEVALDVGAGDLAASAFMTVLKCRPSPGTLLQPVTLLRLLRASSAGAFGSIGQQPAVVQPVLQKLGLLPLTPTTLARWSQQFTGSARADAVAMLARADLRDAALKLYETWASIDLPQDAGMLLSRRARRFFGLGRNRSRLPVLPEGMLSSGSHEPNAVATSSSCMLALVNMLAKDKTFSDASQAFSSNPALKRSAKYALRDLDHARTIVEIYRYSRQASGLWHHLDITSLARAHFKLRDAEGAFDALQGLINARVLPDEVDIAVLLDGMMTLDPDRAVQLVTAHTVDADSTVRFDLPSRESLAGPNRPPGPHVPATFRPTASILSQLINRAANQGRFDLVGRLMELASYHNLQHSSELHSWRALVSRTSFTPQQLASTLQSLVRTGFRPAPGFIVRAAKDCLEKRTMSYSGDEPASSDGPAPAPGKGMQDPDRAPPHIKLSRGLQAALDLSHLLYKEIGVVDTSLCLALLSSLRSMGKSVFRAYGQAQASGHGSREKTDGLLEVWRRQLDRLASDTRWAALVDDGKLTRSGGNLDLTGKGAVAGSNGGDEELSMYDMDDMGDLARRMQEGHRKYSRRRAREAAAEVVDERATDLTDVDEAKADTANESAVDGSTPSPAPRDQDPEAQRPNILSPRVYHEFILTYLHLSDYAGAAEVAAWMRDEAQLDAGRSKGEQADFVRMIKHFLQRHSGKRSDRGHRLLEELAGRRQIARTKSWWRPTIENRARGRPADVRM